MDVEGEYASTDIRYRGNNSIKGGKAGAKPKASGLKRKVTIVAEASDEVSKCLAGGEVSVVDGAECSGDEKVKNVEEVGAECIGGAGETFKGENEKLSVESVNIECCGVGAEVGMGEKEKGGASVGPVGGGGNNGAECGRIRQMSREKLWKLFQHLNGGKGECSVVLFC